MPLVPEFHWCQSLVPVSFNIAHVLFVCRQLAPETGTGYWYQKTRQCVWPLRKGNDDCGRLYRYLSSVWSCLQSCRRKKLGNCLSTTSCTTRLHVEARLLGLVSWLESQCCRFQDSSVCVQVSTAWHHRTWERVLYVDVIPLKTFQFKSMWIWSDLICCGLASPTIRQHSLASYYTDDDSLWTLQFICS